MAASPVGRAAKGAEYDGDVGMLNATGKACQGDGNHVRNPCLVPVWLLCSVLLSACAPGNIVSEGPPRHGTAPAAGHGSMQAGESPAAGTGTDRRMDDIKHQGDLPGVAMPAGHGAKQDAGEGLDVPGLDPPGRTWSDLLWSKEDYRAWIQGRAYRTPLSPARQVSTFPLSSATAPVAPAAGVLDDWRLGARGWDYSTRDGLAVRLGSSEVGSSVLSRSATLGGMHLRHQGLTGYDDSRPWSLSLSVGALDYADGDGDLSYGPVAANTVIQYGLGNNLALESAVQAAPGLLTASWGARVDAGPWGQLRGGVAHGGLDEQRGRRYQATWNVEWDDALHVSVRNEWESPGFADLGRYRGAAGGGMRRNWAATIPTRNWGDIRGTYETWQPVTGPDTQRFGFSQQFWYSPNLRIGLHGQREVGGGDYDIGILFSVPIK